MWELNDAFKHANLHIAIWPLLAGTIVMTVAAFIGGSSVLFTTFILTLFAVVAWHIALAMMSRTAISRLNIMASVFSATYLPFMAAFIVLLLNRQNGNWLVILLILLSVANDTGGYFMGVLFGKHPMAPSVSPKKSWEGFSGSVLLAAAVGIFGTHWVMGLPFIANTSGVGNAGWPNAIWLHLFGSAVGLGLMLGIVAAITSTLGDLSESLIKRDLGIKDMGSILPGHGGVLDRIDSILMSAPWIYLIFTIAGQWTYPYTY
jgi:phosphatidate cytidylyltransferase